MSAAQDGDEENAFFTPARPVRILHVEDSALDQALLRRSLQHGALACHITAVDTLAAVRQALASAPFDLLLADYYLKGFTGMDVWQMVRAGAAAPPFVLLSGAIGEEAAVDAMRQGISDYVFKRDMRRLPQVIAQVLRMQRARQEKARAVAELAESEKRLAALTGHLHDLMEQGRASVAREIHDDIGGALTAVKFDVAWIARHATQEGVRAHARAALDMIEHALGASQRIMLDLRPPVLDQGLVAAVRWLAQDFSRRSGVPAQVQCSSEALCIDAAVQVVAYRTVQEALTNIAKHAKAHHVRIELSDREGFLTVEVSDDGQGMAPGAREKPRSFGLRGLAERARSVGGWLDVSSHGGRGTSVIVSIPLKAETNCR